MHRALGFGAGLLAMAVSACAFAPQMGRVAVDHNRMVARSTDELTLLNIVRASHRFPLHFTAISSVNGNVTAGTGGNLGLDLDPRVDPTSAGLGVNVETSPGFQASVLATEKFQRGIQTPLAPELLAYYLGEGWRDGLLLALAVERVEAANGTIITNDPEADGDFARLLCSHELVSVPSAASVPLARFEQLLDSALLASDTSTPAARRGEITALLGLLGNDRVRLTGDTLVLEGSSNVVALRARSSSRCPGVSADPRLAGQELRPHFRSTLGVIYFLGEYQRLRSGGGPAAYRVPHCADPCPVGAAELRPLIAIDRGGGEALVETRFEGQRFYIPASEAGVYSDQPDQARGMQVIAFVEQLVNLQKSADQLPTTLTVTGLN